MPEGGKGTLGYQRGRSQSRLGDEGPRKGCQTCLFWGSSRLREGLTSVWREGNVLCYQHIIIPPSSFFFLFKCGKFYFIMLLGSGDHTISAQGSFLAKLRGLYDVYDYVMQSQHLNPFTWPCGLFKMYKSSRHSPSLSVGFASDTSVCLFIF